MKRLFILVRQLLHCGCSRSSNLDISLWQQTSPCPLLGPDNCNVENYNLSLYVSIFAAYLSVVVSGLFPLHEDKVWTVQSRHQVSDVQSTRLPKMFREGKSFTSSDDSIFYTKISSFIFSFQTLPSEYLLSIEAFIAVILFKTPISSQSL